MKVIVPMAGTGDRFIAKGYSDPKPLICVNGKRIIAYILDMYKKEDEFVFICNEEHLMQTNMREILMNLAPHSKIISIPKHKLGPVHTAMAALSEIDDEEEVIISYCDNPFLWEYEKFKDYVKAKNLDGCILTHTGFHPHTLSSTKMAFIKMKDELVEEVQEKKSYTKNPMNENASTGVYYFRRGDIVKKYFSEQIELGKSHNGEYYVTLTYNLLIRDGLKVGCYDTQFVTVFGTPEEVENFEAWAKILQESQVKNEQDLISCYKYWRAYHDKSHLR